MLKRKFKIPKVEKPNRSCIRKWRQFVLWLRNQKIFTKMYFVNHSESKRQTSRNRRILTLMGLNRIETFGARQEEKSRVFEFGNQMEHVEEKIGRAS